MLKRVTIPGYGPFVFGRKEPVLRTVEPFQWPSTLSPEGVLPPVDHDAIRDAAKLLHPIYKAEEDILANDRYGDCTCAGILHIAAILQGLKGGVWRLPTATDATWLYSKVTNPPFNPATGANDNGADLETVMSFVRSNGAYRTGDFKIGQPYAVDGTDPDLVKVALDTHRILYMGAGLPDEWIPKTAQVPKVWDVAGDPDPSNGHCVIAYDYNDVGVQIDTWGCFVTVTWAALAKYFSANGGGELYAFDMA